MSNRNLRPVVRAAMVAALLLGTCVFSGAQTERPVSFNIGAGFSPLLGKLNRRLDNGWNISGGVAYNVSRWFSIGPQFTYNGLGISRGLLNQVGAPDGDAHVWSITADPRIRIPVGERFSPYIVGGVGYYRRSVNFTQPALEPVALIDPFFGYVFPGLIGVNQVLARNTRNGIGGNLGAGWTINVGSSGAQLFTEARYHYADTGSIRTRMIPVTFGLRF